MNPNSCQSLSLDKKKADILRLLKNGVNRKDAHRQLFHKCGCNCAEPPVDLSLFNAAIRNWRDQDPKGEWTAIPKRSCYPNLCTSTHIGCDGQVNQEYAALHSHTSEKLPSMNGDSILRISDQPLVSERYDLSVPEIQGNPQPTFSYNPPVYNGYENSSQSILDAKTSTRSFVYNVPDGDCQQLPSSWGPSYTTHSSISESYSPTTDPYSIHPSPYITPHEPYGTMNNVLGISQLENTMSPNQGFRAAPMTPGYVFAPEPLAQVAIEAPFDGKRQIPGNEYGFDSMDENE